MRSRLHWERNSHWAGVEIKRGSGNSLFPTRPQQFFPTEDPFPLPMTRSQPVLARRKSRRVSLVGAARERGP